MRRYLLALFLVLSTIVSAQKKAEPLVKVRAVDSRFQFVSNKNLLPVDQNLWDEVEPFVNNFSRVLLNNKFSFVNINGKPILPVEFEAARNFSNGLAAVKRNGKWGFINENGTVICDSKYDVVFDFSDTVSVSMENNKWYLINNNGKEIKSLDVDVCFGFINGKAKIVKAKSEGYIDRKGTITYTGSVITKDPLPPYHPNQNLITGSCPDNLDFEFGNFTNWQCYIGSVDSVGTTNVITVNPSPPTVNRHTIIPRAVPVSLLDPFGLFPTNPPDGSNYAVKLGNTSVGAQAERISYTIHVPLNDSNFSIVYDYAVVFQDPGHTPWTQPRFITRLLDSATNTYIDCASFEYISTSNLPGFAVSPVDPSVIYKPWASVFYNLRGQGGKTLYLEFTNADCVRRGHWGYAYIDVESICGNPIQATYNCNPPNITTLTGPPGFEFYNWWDSTFSTLLGTGRTVTLNPGPSINDVIWLEMIPFSTFGCQDTIKVTITGELNGHFDMSDTAACAPHTFTFYNKNLPSATTFWDFGDGNTGTGDTVSHTYSTPGTYYVQLTVTQNGGCYGSATQKVVVHPEPSVNKPPDQLLCNGANTNTVIFSGNNGSNIYYWTNNNTSIGLGASGNGNIPAFTAVNTGTTPVTATITVTPTVTSCSGPPQIFTITVKPSPDVVQPASQNICNGTNTAAVNFTGAVAGTTFSWTNNNTSIGLGASGNGNIPVFTAVNNGNTSVTATITVTPSAAGCPGTPKSFTIIVKPSPDVVQPASQNICNGANTTAVNFTGAVTGTTFSWTNNNTSIGLGASGNGNITAFAAINTGTTTVTATITVTPSAAGCPGTPQNFTITVKPTPNVLQPSNQSLCNRATTAAVNFTGAVTGTIYSWTNNNTSIGLGGSGNGNIAAFTAVNTGTTSVTATITVTPSAAGCPGTPQNFTIIVMPSPDVVQPDNQNICNGFKTNVVSFSGSLSGSVYNWTNNNTSIGLAASGNGNIPAFTAVNNGNTSVTATITVTATAGTCSALPTIFKITVNPTPLVKAGNNTDVCLGKSIQLNATGAADYYWNPASSLSCTGCANPVATPIDNIRYTVKGVSSFGCEAYDSVLLTVIKPFQILISPDDTLCIGESSNLTASGANTYLWSPPQGLSRTDIANPTAKPNATTLYRVVGYDGHNCFTDTSFVKIIVGPIPTVNLGADLNLTTGTVITLNPVIQNGPIVNWLWTPATGLSCTNCPAPTLTVTDDTYYKVTVTNNFGCIGTDIISIFTFCKSAQVFIPNAFTPDGDGLNDILMVRGKGIFVKSFRIFNRWGELVFERNNFSPNDIKYGWDGKVRGIPATSDVFVYTAEVICDNGIIYTYKGNTTLLK